MGKKYKLAEGWKKSYVLKYSHSFHNVEMQMSLTHYGETDSYSL